MKTHRYRVAVWLALILCTIARGYGHSLLMAEQPTAAAEPDDRTISIIISKDTTYFTEPLTKDGFVDYVAALNARYGQGVKAEDNAAVALWRITSDKVSDEHRARALKLWGIQPPDGPLVPIMPLYDEQRHKDADREEIFRQQTEALDRPWTEKEFPAIAAWIKANDDVLKIALAASEKPGYFHPFLDPDGLADEPSSDQVVHASQVANLLRVRAMLRIGQQQNDEAWRDLLALARLGRLLSLGVTLREWTIGIALQIKAYRGMEQYLRYVPLGDDTAQSHRRELAKLPSGLSARNKIDVFDRCVALEYARYFALRTRHARESKMLVSMIGNSR